MSMNEQIPEPPKPKNIALMKLMEMRNELKKQKNHNITQPPQSLLLQQKSPPSLSMMDSGQKVTPTKKELFMRRPELPQQRIQDIQNTMNKSIREREPESKNESEENLETARRTETPKFGWKSEDRQEEQGQIVSPFHSEIQGSQNKDADELDKKKKQNLQQSMREQEKINYPVNNNEQEHHSADEKQNSANNKSVGKQFELQVIPETGEKQEKQGKKNQQIVNKSTGADKDIEIGVQLNKPQKIFQHASNNAVEPVISIDSVHDQRKRQKKVHKILLKEHLVVKEITKNLGQALRGLQYIRTNMEANPLAKSHIRDTLKLISKLFEQR